MDKRRYQARSPRAPKDPKGMAEETTGNPALDGFSVRHRKPLKQDPYSRRDDRYSEQFAAGSMMTEGEAALQEFFGDE